MTKTAFAYLRVSGKGQVKGDGFPRQLAAIQQYAKAHGIRIKKVFREEGVSGAKELENRPALSELMTALHSNGTRLVLVEKLDRLARTAMIQEALIEDLQKHRFELISVMEPDLLKDDPQRKFMRLVFGAMAELEKSLIVVKLRAARERKRAKTGRCEGRKPFGHYPGEKRAIERMRALRKDGAGYQAIAVALDSEGLPTRKGSPWQAASVRRILLASFHRAQGVT
jgi:DNA invertase Pin-like site-specific DNA recombinase